MVDRLADELLREILAPPLLVSDNMFCNVDHVSPFSKVDHSASDVLLVCKRWMRVATPCLYHTVVIRSTAQAFAFNAAVTRNAEFGRFTKRFRLEYSYPRYITKDVIATMPNIEALCVPTGVLGTDRPNDVHALLDQTHPRHLILVNYRRNQSNVTYRKLLVKICDTISRWNGLNRLTCSVMSIWTLHDKLAPVLASGIVIQNVVLDASDPWFPGNNGIVQAVLAQPKLQTLTFTTEKPRSQELIPPDFENDERALRCLHFIWSDDKTSLRDLLAAQAFKAGIASTAEELSGNTLNSFWRPMERFSREQRVAIWRQIVSYAIELSEGAGPVIPYWAVQREHVWFDVDYFNVAAAKKLIFVSSELRDATIQTLCKHLSPADNLAVERLCALFDRDPVMIGLPKTLTIQSAVRHNAIGISAQGAGAAEIFSRIRHLERLRLVGTSVAPTSWLSLVGPAVGHSLRSLRVDKSYGALEPATTLDAIAIFDGLAALETFWWSTEDIRFKPIAAASVSRSSRGLCRLQTVELNKFHQSITDALASWPSLPSLTQFVLHLGARKAQGFIRQHGASIKRFTAPPGMTQGDFDSLTALESMTLTQDQQAGFFRALKSPSVQEIILKWPSEGLKWRDRYSVTAHLLQAHRTTHFPSLRTITVGGWGGDRLWPVDERSEMRNLWIPLSAAFSAAGVTLKDKHGRGWRPRLTLSGSGGS